MKLSILGSTGSIGTSTLDVVRQNPEKFSVESLVAGQNTDLLSSQILEYKPRTVVVASEKALDALRASLKATRLAEREWPELGCGAQGHSRGSHGS